MMMSHRLPERNKNNPDGMIKLIESDFPATDITAEKNLWQILKTSFLLPKRIFNIVSTASFFVVVSCYALLSQDSSWEARNQLLSWAEKGFSFSVGILGFLVAGVAIFTAANDVSLFTHLARVRHRQSGVSYLKYNFIALMYVFIVYILLAFLCFLVQALASMSDVFDKLLISLIYIFPRVQIDADVTFRLVNKFSYALLSTLFFYCLLLLKTFIFDLYALIMVNIRWNFEKEEDEKNSGIDQH